MSSKAIAQLRIEGWLVAEDPLHIGGVGVSEAADLIFAVDGLDRVYVPGTSLTGALRAWCEGPDPAGADGLKKWWGYVEEGGEGGEASRVIVDDALVYPSLENAKDSASNEDNALLSSLATSAWAEIRTGIGIDRVTGAVAPHILYERAILPSGSALQFRLMVEARDTEELGQLRKALGSLSRALRQGEISLGAGKSRGLGRVWLAAETRFVEERHDSVDSLLDMLSGMVEWEPIDDLIAEADDSVLPRRPHIASIEVEWEPVGPLMVRAAVDGFAVDSLPLVGRIAQDGLKLVLPGSSAKGALRARAEWIVRTVLQVDAPDRKDLSRKRFLEQVGQPELDLVRALFGAAPSEDHGSANGGRQEAESLSHTESGINDSRPTAPPQEGISALWAHDCFSKVRLTPDEWQELVAPTGTAQGTAQAEGTSAKKERATLSDQKRDSLAARGLYEQTHVAIDRWTGGAAGKRLYSVLEPRHVAWPPLRLTLHLDYLEARLGADSRAALALLLLTLRDLGDGTIPLGYATMRGMGDVRVKTITLRGVPRPRDEIILQERDDRLSLEDLPFEWRSELEAGWQKWIEAHPQ